MTTPLLERPVAVRLPRRQHRHVGQPGHAAADDGGRGPRRLRDRRATTCAISALAYAVYWLGDILDGWLARRLDQETRLGAVLDIVSDRACTALLCAGLLAHLPGAWVLAVAFLLSFAVLDTMLSLCVPVLADPRPQRLPPRRRSRVAAELVAARQGRQHRRRRRRDRARAGTPWGWSSSCGRRREGLVGGAGAAAAAVTRLLAVLGALGTGVGLGPAPARERRGLRGRRRHPLARLARRGCSCSPSLSARPPAS